MEITTLKTEAKLIERKSICKLGDGGETSLKVWEGRIHLRKVTYNEVGCVTDVQKHWNIMERQHNRSQMKFSIKE